MKLIALLLLSLAISGTKQACAAGCLKCDASSNCLIADISKNYVLSAGTAVVSPLTNCQILSATGTCTNCNAGYFLDSTGKCTVVPTASVITNCQYYASATTCRLCNSGFYVNNNVCAAVTTTVANCSAYASATACAACASTYILSLDSSSCVSVSSLSNCSGYTYVTCDSCASGYHLNRNDYLTSNVPAVVNASNLNNIVNEAYAVITGTNFMGMDVCTSNANTNCTTFTVDTNTCTACNAGYFLDTTGACNLYPLAPILNCGVYTNASTCQYCNAGYTLTNATTCTAVPSPGITNCATYNTGISTVSCVACNTGFYVSNNTCAARVNSANIASCATYDANNDLCATCAANTIITSDFLKCNAVIANCQTHTSVDKNGVIQCSVCNPTYYLTPIANGGTQNSCTLGSIASCSAYNTTNNPPTCSTCLNGYYLNAGACTQQPAITNCSSYDVANQGVCTTCNPANSVVATLGNVCVAATPISNCAILAGTVASPTCNTCASTYFLTNSTTCTKITAQNCTAGTSVTACTKCAAGTVLNASATNCVAPFAFITDQCQQTALPVNNNLTISSQACVQCKQGSIPFAYSANFVCMSPAEIRVANNDTDIQSGYAADCLKIGSNFSCVQCNPAGTNKFLSLVNSPTTCVASCTNGFDRYIVNNTTFEITQFNVCKSAAPAAANANCAIYGPSLSAATPSFNSVCVGCNSTSFPVVTYTQTDYSNVDPKATDPTASAVAFTTYIPAPFARYPTVVCKPYTGNTINGQTVSNNTSPITNCDYYVVTATSTDYACARCSYGYSGVPNANGFITACTQIADCINTPLYRNLSGFANNVVSCRSCTTPGNIPILVYNSNTANSNDVSFASFVRYNYAAASPYAADNTNTVYRNIECRAGATSPNGVTNWSITSTCGIAGVISNSNSGSNSAATIAASTQVGNYCIACKPGNAPSATGIAVGKTCTAIAGCTNGGTMFDGCSKCDDLYVLAFNASPAANTSNINFTSCLSYASTARTAFTNCYAANPNTQSAGAALNCAVCNTGYNLNLDNICEAIQPYNCAANAFKTSLPFAAASAEWSLALTSNGLGCNKCLNNNIAFQLATSTNVCVPSAYVANTVDTLTTSNYIEHCKIYSIDPSNNFTCLTCETNYIPDSALKNCYLSNATALTNCGTTTIANTPVCAECATQAFFLDANGVCNAGAIANCSVYNYTTLNNLYQASHTASNCLQCVAGYYPAADKLSCLAATVPNCAVNASAIRCSACATSYTLIDNSSANNVADACIPNPTVGNCGILANITSSTISCTTCATPASQVLVANPATTKSTCLPFSPITSCTAYTVGSLTGSAFGCSTCPSTAYLSNNSCVTRTTITNCAAYTANADTCTTCATGYFLSADQKTCTAYPNGIFKCANYSSANTCTFCSPGYYLASNACTAVTTTIGNCVDYATATTCLNCATNYVASGNTCVAATAQNCATYTSASACKSCNQGYVLTTSNNVTNCTALTKTGCATIDYTTQKCTSCNTSYYLASDGTCAAATTIARCTVYASATTCAQCDVGYVLSTTATTCITNTNLAAYDDGNCNNSKQVSTPTCSRCSAGYYFVGGSCTGTCSVTGCLACSPSNNSACYICNTNFYQDSTGNCVAISTNATTTNKSASIFGVLSAFMVLIVVMFK